MALVAPATEAAAAGADDVSEDECSDVAPFTFAADEAGSDMEMSDDDTIDDRGPPPPPPENGADGGWRARVHEQWKKFQSTFRRGTEPTNPDDTHFAAWEDVNKPVQLRDPPEFQLHPGIKARIRPHRFDADKVTELECFEKMITPDMQERIIRCTNRKVERIVAKEIPAPKSAKKWPPVWAEKWAPLTQSSLHAFFAVQVC